MEYTTNQTAYNNGQDYESKRRLYDNVVNNARMPPQGEYLTGGSPPDIADSCASCSK